jgi:hypothetical protein
LHATIQRHSKYYEKKPTIYIIILSFLFLSYSYSQSSSYIITSSNDTIKIDKFNILNKKIKIKKNGSREKYTYKELIAIYDSEKDKYYEKISPPYIEYESSSGNTFFAERLTIGKVIIYKYLTNQSHAPISNGNGDLISGSNNFYSYFIGIQDAHPELLGYNEIQMTKNEFKLLKLYLHSNSEIQEELESLFFSEEKEKENSVLELVNKYNQWAELKK